jgi:NAD-dependent deacetylase
MNKNLDLFIKLFNKSHHTVILTGAGISTSCGIPDFRSDKGLYSSKEYKNPDKIFDIDYFFENPSFFYSFYKNFLPFTEKANPSFTHYFLSDLEKRGKINQIITQNIDFLHQKSGSENVYELHGSINKNYCYKCKKEFSLEHIIYNLKFDIVPLCETCKLPIKPDIVFFGEPIKDYEKSLKQVEKCDLLIIIGSSLSVMPAGYLPYYAKKDIVIINKGYFESYYIRNKNNLLHFDIDIDQFFKKIETAL